MDENFDDGPMPILEKTTVSRKLPANFRQDDRWLFINEIEKEIPRIVIRKLKWVKLSPEGLLFFRNRILPDSFAFSPGFKKWKKRTLFKSYIHNYLLRKTRRVEFPVLWVTDVWSGGYFHWLCDALPRLVAAFHCVEKAFLVLPRELKGLPFVRESLKLLNVQNVEYIGPDEVLLCSTLLLPSHTAISGDFNEPIVKQLHNMLRPNEDLGSGQGAERLYVSRARAIKRRISNEAEIIDLLKEYDFKIVTTEDMSFEEQVKLFRSAACLVSNHGAGLTNMLFMKPGGSVLELRKDDDNVNNCYFNMSSALDLRYYYQLCKSPTDEDAHTADIIVDKAGLVKTLELMLSG